MPGIIAGSVGLIFPAVIAHAVAMMGSKGSLDRNTAPGLRTKATLASDEGWKRAHRTASAWLTVAALTGYFFGVSSVLAAFVSLVVGAAFLIAGHVGVVVLLLLSTFKANAAAKRATQSASLP